MRGRVGAGMPFRLCSPASTAPAGFKIERQGDAMPVRAAGKGRETWNSNSAELAVIPVESLKSERKGR